MARRKPRRSSEHATRLVGYARVSTEEQAREGVSLQAQHGRLTAYCTAHDLQLVGIEQDAGVSGKVAPAQRPGLARALDLVRKGGADGVVVLKLDRLSRSTRDVLDLVDETRRGPTVQPGWDPPGSCHFARYRTSIARLFVLPVS